MQDIKIDLVYLWVDDKDEEWQKKRRFWANKLGVVSSEENSDCRYSNNDELKYSLRSAEMYAPWINKIFIVTDGQTPEWLDTNHPKIRIVDHKDIMPEDCLPCFNSAAIEACIDNIPDLSEYFLYANDDMFFASPVGPDYFFDKNNNPIVNLRPRQWELAKNLYMQRILYTINIFQEQHKLSKTLLRTEPYHCIDAYRKSYFKDCKKDFENEFKTLITKRFRTKDTIQRIIFSLYQLENSPSTLVLNPEIAKQEFHKQVDNLYLNLTDENLIKDRIKNQSPKLLCINDNDIAKKIERKRLRGILSNLFPKKAEWEKSIKFQIEPCFTNQGTYAFVFSFNDAYAKYFAVLLQSLIANSNPKNNYDLVILSSGVDENNKILLRAMLPENFSLRFYDITEYILENFPNFKLKTMNNWSVEMYYRIFIPLIMSSYTKVLYLDTDIIINASLDELFNVDFEDNEAIVVHDTTSQVFHLESYKERLEHVKNCLKLQDETNYFNSGMIMFNIPHIDKEIYTASIINTTSVKELLYPDQDILNIIFENKVKFVSTKWNFCCGKYVWNREFINCLTGEYKEDFIESLENPKIIHYTSPKKPWNSNLSTHFEKFWQYARLTPFYEEIIYEMNREAATTAIVESTKYSNLYIQTHNNKRIVFWGASLFLEDFIKRYELINDNVIGIIDKNPNKKGQFLGQYEIFCPEDLNRLKPEVIIITIVNSARERALEVKKFLQENYNNNIEIKTI